MEEIYIDYKNNKVRFLINSVEQSDFVVCMMHGRGDYSESYVEFSNFLKENKISSMIVDLIGHGKSSGKRGVVRKFDDYIEQTRMLEDLAKEKFPSAKIIFLGLSLGGNIILSSVRESRIHPYKVIVLAPWISLVRKLKGYEILYARILKTVNPEYTIATNNDFKIDSNKSTLRHNRINGTILWGAYFNGMKLMKNSLKNKMPILLIHSKGDLTTDYNASKKFSEINPNVQLVSLESNEHGLFWGANKKEVMSTILSFILEKP